MFGLYSSKRKSHRQILNYFFCHRLLLYMILEKLENARGVNKYTNHGELSSTFLMEKETWLKIGFQSRIQAEAVSKIIKVHDNGDILSLPEEEYCIGNPPGVFLRDLASIFRLADMLDTTESRSPYLAMSLMDLGFSGTIGLWVARSSLGAWDISEDSKKIFLIGSTDKEEARMSALAYVDNLNRQLTDAHKKYLEHCRLRQWKGADLNTNIATFPTEFSYVEFENSTRKELGGLIKIYTEFAEEYLQAIKIANSKLSLKGIGDFSEKEPLSLNRVFVDLNVTLSSIWHQEN